MVQSHHDKLGFSTIPAAFSFFFKQPFEVLNV